MTSPDAANQHGNQHDDPSPTSGRDHLIPYRWKPGQSGNPAGRPKGSNAWRTMLKECGGLPASEIGKLRDIASTIGIPTDSLESMSVAEVIARCQFFHCARGKGVATNVVAAALRGNLTPGKMMDMETTATDATGQERERSIQFYESVVDSEDATIGDRLRARQSLDILHGLIEVEPRSPHEVAESIREALGLMRDDPPSPGKPHWRRYRGSGG